MGSLKGRASTSASKLRVGMTSHEKILERILPGTSDANIGFTDLCHLLRRLAFEERIKGSQAKPYQVRQVRQVILRHGLGGAGGTE